MNRHVSSVHEGNKPFKYDICDYSSYLKHHKNNMFNQFMKEISHSNMTFVTVALIPSIIKNNMSNQFMKEISHSKMYSCCLNSK